MKEVLKSGYGKVNKYKGKIKKVIIGTVIVAVVGVVAATGFGYYYVSSNINYDESAAEKIALEKVSGEILNVHKDIDDGIVQYEFSIRDENNNLVKVTVDSKYGAIVDSEIGAFGHMDR